MTIGTTYNELVRRAPLWLYANNSELVTEMPAIIERAQDMLSQRIDHDHFRGEVTGKTVTTTGLIDLSAESPLILELRSIEVDYYGTGGYTALKPRDHGFLSAMYPAGETGRPRFYAEYDGPLKLRVFPTPSETYTLRVTANTQPVALASGNQTNALTDEVCSRALEIAVYREAAIFMKDAEGVALYNGELNNAMDEANAAISRRQRDETDRPVVDPGNKGAVGQ